MNEKEIIIKARNLFRIIFKNDAELLENLPIIKYRDPQGLLKKLRQYNTYLSGKGDFYVFLLIRELQYLSTSFQAYYRLRTKYKSLNDMTEKKRNELFNEFLQIEHIEYESPKIYSLTA